MPNSNTSTPIIIKKYSNRRLYNTQTSTYITLEDLCQMVKKGEEFEVIDAKTNENLTRFILTQIIFEQESKGYNLLPTDFLKQLIRFYDDSLQQVLSHYLTASMSHFTKNREQMQQFLKLDLSSLEQFSQFTPLNKGVFEEITKQNMALFEQAAQVLTLFTPKPGPKTEKE